MPPHPSPSTRRLSCPSTGIWPSRSGAPDGISGRLLLVLVGCAGCPARQQGRQRRGMQPTSPAARRVDGRPFGDEMCTVALVIGPITAGPSAPLRGSSAASPGSEACQETLTRELGASAFANDPHFSYPRIQSGLHHQRPQAPPSSAAITARLPGETACENVAVVCSSRWVSLRDKHPHRVERTTRDGQTGQGGHGTTQHALSRGQGPSKAATSDGRQSN